MLLFYSRNVVVLAFTLRSVFHLELIFVIQHGVRVEVCLFGYPIGSTPLLERLFFHD